MRDKDRFSITKTGEAPLNPWFTKSRIMKILKEVERLRNVNRHTIKFNNKQIKEYVERSEQLSDLFLHRYFAEYEEIQGNVDSVAEVEKEMLTLPKYLREELTQDKKIFYSEVKDEYLVTYYEQLIKVLPPRLAKNFEAAGNIYEILVANPEEVDQKNSLLETK